MSDISTPCLCSALAEAESLSETEIDARLNALADELSRHFLGYLIAKNPGPVSVSAAVTHVADVTDRPLEEVRTLMHHRIWPRLVEIGLVTYDPSTDRLSYAGGTFTEAVLRSISYGSPTPYITSGASNALAPVILLVTGR